MRQDMEKKGFWKKIAGLLVLLIVAFVIGIFIGMPIGRQRAEKEAVNRQEQAGDA